MAAFSASRRTVSYTRRYHQPNSIADDGQTYSSALHAEDLAGFIRGLNAGQVDLIGESYGGLVALEMARRHPELVRALVLAEPAAVGLLARTPSGDSIRRAALAGLQPLRAMFARGDSVAALSAWIGGTGGPTNGLDGVRPATRAYFLTQVPELRREVTAPEALYEPVLTCADLEPIRMPTLVLRSERATPMFSRIIDEVAACLPTARVATIPKAGHTMSQDNPASFATTVLGFLKSPGH